MQQLTEANYRKEVSRFVDKISARKSKYWWEHPPASNFGPEIVKGIETAYLRGKSRTDIWFKRPEESRRLMLPGAEPLKKHIVSLSLGLGAYVQEKFPAAGHHLEYSVHLVYFPALFPELLDHNPQFTFPLELAHAE